MGLLHSAHFFHSALWLFHPQLFDTAVKKTETLDRWCIFGAWMQYHGPVWGEVGEGQAWYILNRLPLLSASCRSSASCFGRRASSGRCCESSLPNSDSFPNQCRADDIVGIWLMAGLYFDKTTYLCIHPVWDEISISRSESGKIASWRCAKPLFGRSAFLSRMVFYQRSFYILSDLWVQLLVSE